jgi:RNA polymerase sigma factor (sigma-70 family)
VDERLTRDPSRFFDELYPSVRRYVSAATGAPLSEVDELVQEILFQAWRDRAQFRGEASAVTWVLSIARNTVRRGGRDRRRKEKGDEVRRALAAIDTDPLPEEILGAAEMGQAVRSALHRIDPSYADVLIRHYCHGLAIREIAGASSETEKAVESRLTRAREALRKELNAGGEHDPE